jgi:hypothetical protein
LPHPIIDLVKKITSGENKKKLDDQPESALREILHALDPKEVRFITSVYFFFLSPGHTPEGLKEFIQNSAEWIVRKTFPLIPEDCLNEELTIHLCNISRDFLSAIPAKFKNKKFYEKFIAQISKSGGDELQYIPAEFLTAKMIKTVLQRDGRALVYLPFKRRTKEICKIAFHQHSDAIRYFPLECMTENIANEAVKRNVKNIPYLSNKFLTEDLVLQYLTHAPSRASVTIFDNRLEKDADITQVNWIPRSLYTNKVLEAIANFQPFDLKQIPADFLTEAILIKAVCSNYSNSNILFKYGKNDKKTIWVPKELLSIKLLQEAVLNAPETLKYLSNAKKKKIFSDSIFLAKFQQDCLVNLYKKYPRNPLKFCFSYFPENVFSLDFFSDLLVTIFIKDSWVFKGQETLKSLPESLLSTDLLLKGLEKLAVLVDKDRRLSEFIFALGYQGNRLTYRSWVPAKLLTRELLQKLVFLEPAALSILPKSAINKLVKDTAFIESLRSKYSRNKRVINIINEKLIRNLQT